MPTLPPIHLFPAKRVLGESGEVFDDLSGKGLIDHLAELQNPGYDKQAEHEKFERINRFLQDVTGKPEARLEVPSGREYLQVHMDNKVLPLSSLGTGIHEVVLIAAFSVIHDGSILCIEEPEIHLHTLLQKKLIAWLLENTSSQYFIATHSSALIDTPGAHVFHVQNDGVQTYVRPTLTKQAQRDILDDLGARPSDILQTNMVIWVEGPSDRIYLNHWIKAVDIELKEGIHYSILFYGGALIRHLSASDEALDEFIKLRELNPNIAIVFDSDRAYPDADLKEPVERLCTEMEDSGGLAWVTKGREIENYIDPDKLQDALKRRYPRIYAGAPNDTGPYGHAFYFKHKGKKELKKDVDKIGVASFVCQSAANLDILDLKPRMTELVAAIRKTNGLK